jgi:hypothetical protein
MSGGANESGTVNQRRSQLRADTYYTTRLQTNSSKTHILLVELPGALPVFTWMSILQKAPIKSNTQRCRMLAQEHGRIARPAAGRGAGCGPSSWPARRRRPGSLEALRRTAHACDATRQEPAWEAHLPVAQGGSSTHSEMMFGLGRAREARFLLRYVKRR